ncbi:helix-turn-helix domain-containing protein [Nonomuraea sp. NPDC049646]|uniref:helix-turn-helix domain-containing protein n=1 Tax=unclassified Nonomuraea TaxID=2593643 RepID=UPI0037969729
MTSRFFIGEGYASYQGPSADNSIHRHAAYQVTAAVEGEVTVVDERETCHRGPALIIPPMVRHRMPGAPDVRIWFVEPQCSYASVLRDRCTPARSPGSSLPATKGTSPTGSRVAPFGSGLASVREVITVAADLRAPSEEDFRLVAEPRPSGELDPRLVIAMEALTSRNLLLADAAAQAGLSPQRLRALARLQLGMPLARWRIWRRLTRAARALADGRSIAEAALDGGFADQAHFHRQLRDMLGLTPATVLPLLRRSAAAGHVDGD